MNVIRINRNNDIAQSYISFYAPASITQPTTYKIKFHFNSIGDRWLVQGALTGWEERRPHCDCTFSTTETTNTYLVPNYTYTVYLDIYQAAFTALGYNINTMEPDNCTLTVYLKQSDGTWETWTEQFFLYSTNHYEYPKVTATYSGTNVVDGYYYDNYSTMTMVVTIQQSIMFGYKVKLSVNDATYPIVIPEDTTVNNTIVSTSMTFTFTKFEDDYVLSVEDYYLHSNSNTISINAFAYQDPQCFESTASRSGNGYNYITLNALGTYAPSIAKTVTMTYKWRYAEASWSAVTTIETVPSGTGEGTIDKAITINAPIDNGDVEIQVAITDTLKSATFTIYVGGPAVFYWNGSRFNITVPVYINTSETPLVVNGVSLEDYIRSFIV